MESPLSENTNPFAPSEHDEVEVELTETVYETSSETLNTDPSAYPPVGEQASAQYGYSPAEGAAYGERSDTSYGYPQNEAPVYGVPGTTPYGYPKNESSEYGESQAYGQTGESPYGAGAYPSPAPGYQQAPYPGPGQPFVQTANGTYQPVAMWSPKSKLAAGLLGIFLGAFGVHNFYLGYTGKAVAQLLITVLSLGLLAWASSIWGLIEGILILASGTGTTWDLDANGYPMPPIGS